MAAVAKVSPDRFVDFMVSLLALTSAATLKLADAKSNHLGRQPTRNLGRWPDGSGSRALAKFAFRPPFCRNLDLDDPDDLDPRQ